MQTIWACMRAGLHLCSMQRGPVPPVSDRDFRFASDEGGWKVLHDAGTAMVVEIDVTDDWARDVAFTTPETGACDDFVAFMAGLRDAALADDGTLRSALARDVFASLGADPATCDLAAMVLRFRPGLEMKSYTSVFDAYRDGLRP